MFGSKKTTDECYKTNEHSNVATFVRALVHMYTLTRTYAHTHIRTHMDAHCI